MQPSISYPDAHQLFQSHAKDGCNTLPICIDIPNSDLITPCSAYLRITSGLRNASEKSSFLLESVTPGSSQARYSFVASDPAHTLSSYPEDGDPLKALEAHLNSYKLIPLPATASHLNPPFKGGAVGYVAYDAIYSFERVLKHRRPSQNQISIPDAFFLISNTILVFDHYFNTITAWSHIRIDGSIDQLRVEYDKTVDELRRIAQTLAVDNETSSLPLPEQVPIDPSEKEEAQSNVGEKGYKEFVRKLRDEHILNGDIIQAVPSQRLTRKTKLHPFNAYRYLRKVNPSPYMFYINCTLQAGQTVQLVGASPECLLSINSDNMVTNHAIAGTIKRGQTEKEDEQLCQDLKNSIKDRAEHIMLVDLARNDLNRVCLPPTVQVQELMQTTKFSHVIHLTSTVVGKLKSNLTRFDAFRSIFPAGTVSGAPKIKAMELISQLEPSCRNIYAGAVGRWNLGKDTQECDTCIAIRTMLFKDGQVFLQAGGGIVWDSDEQEEFEETINKLKANVKALEKAEEYYANLQNK